VFAGECLEGEPRPSREGTLEWLSAPELATRPLVEDVAVLLRRILQMRADDPPFAARSFYVEGNLRLEFA